MDSDSVRLDRMLDRNSPVPLYRQLKQIFMDRIGAGMLESGDIIPSEKDLAAKYRVSRTTVRLAMGELEKEGYIYRQRGKPTLVSARPAYHGVSDLGGFTDDMQRQGIKPGSKVLAISVISADTELAARLDLNEGEGVIMNKRLRLANGRPICVVRSYLPMAKVDSLSPSDIEGDNSLYRYLRERLGYNLSAVEEIVDIVAADSEEATLLEISSGDHVVRLQRTVYTDRNERLEYGVSLWREDRFKYIAWRRSDFSYFGIRAPEEEVADLAMDNGRPA